MAWHIHTWAEHATFYLVLDIHILKLNLSTVRESHKALKSHLQPCRVFSIFPFELCNA